MCQALDHVENSTEEPATGSNREPNENPNLEEQNDSTNGEEIEDEDLQSIEKGIKELDVLDEDETNDELPVQSDSNETNVSDSKINEQGSDEKNRRVAR